MHEGVYIEKTLKIVIIVFAVIAAVVIAGGAYLGMMFPSQEEIEKSFFKNKGNIMMVASYLENLEYRSITIRPYENGKMNTYIDGYIQIDDPQVLKAINVLLHQKGFIVIEKTGNTIYFIRSSGLDYSSGVAYSIDGNEPELQYLTRVEPLSESNWYCFEKDYNLWRQRQNLLQ